MVNISLKKSQVDYLIRLIIRSESYSIDQIENLPIVKDLLCKLSGNGNIHSSPFEIEDLIEWAQKIERLREH